MRVLALLVLVACGGSDAIEPLDPRDPTATSGSRLVAERWISADGTATFARWYDRELDIHCAFERADGRFRCVPTAARIGAQFGAGRFLVAFGKP